MRSDDRPDLVALLPHYEALPVSLWDAIEIHRRREAREHARAASRVRSMSWLEYALQGAMVFEPEHPAWAVVVKLVARLGIFASGLCRVTFQARPDKRDGAWLIGCNSSERYVDTVELLAAAKDAGLEEIECPWCGTTRFEPDRGCDCRARTYCIHAGEAAHTACGWCQEHDRPRFQCRPECWPAAGAGHDRAQ